MDAMAPKEKQHGEASVAPHGEQHGVLREMLTRPTDRRAKGERTLKMRPRPSRHGKGLIRKKLTPWNRMDTQVHPGRRAMARASRAASFMWLRSPPGSLRKGIGDLGGLELHCGRIQHHSRSAYSSLRTQAHACRRAARMMRAAARMVGENGCEHE